ncbi:hypothetical protein FPANT_6698 [Fusarium pseudoanthophilum]|uniref:Uncharacterized protein n=1 Tax=Fusarium pseudoanthophilum TaxID=48495 RepID=A0A8H5LCK7_9HYPO|nr:hypothetical protein FPANT_6698 [Fusarium pseudoanthophilum]
MLPPTPTNPRKSLALSLSLLSSNPGLVYRLSLVRAITFRRCTRSLILLSLCSAVLTTELPKMHHCIHCLEHSAWWVPSDALQSDDVEPYGCTLTICAVRGKDGTKGCDQCDNENSWEPASLSLVSLPRSAANIVQLRNEHVQLLQTFHLHQLCDWISDAAFLNDSLVVDLHRKIEQARTQLKGTATARHVGGTASAAATTTTNGNVERNGEIALQVQMDISNCLREILETLQRRGSSCGTTPASSEEDEEPMDDPKSGKKRTAPDGNGQTETGGEEPRTK